MEPILPETRNAAPGTSCGNQRLESACYTVSLRRLGQKRQLAAHSVCGLLATTVYGGTRAVKEIGMLPYLRIFARNLGLAPSA